MSSEPRHGHRPRQARDPRTIITPYAFEVAPELLDRPLATPWARLGAITVDLVLIGVLTLLGPVVLGIVAAVAFLRIVTRRKARSTASRVAKYAFGCFGGIVVLSVATCVAVPLFWGSSEERQQAAREVARELETELREEGVDLTAGQVLEGFAQGARFRRASSPEEAREAAEAVARRLRQAGGGDAEVREVLRSLVPADSFAPWKRALVDSVVAGAPAGGVAPGPDTAPSPDTAPTVAIAPGPDTAAGVEAPAGERIAGLREQIARLEEENEALEEELDDLEGRIAELREGGAGLVGLVVGAIGEEFGLGIGWLGIYLTLFPLWWNGQTPGKRLLGIRVVQLDNSPISLWESFERFGGYAAGFATGFFGFLQVFWDPNRQAIHDRIAGTVVVSVTDDDDVYGRRPEPERWRPGDAHDTRTGKDP